jgi:hypothetical protein
MGDAGTTSDAAADAVADAAKDGNVADANPDVNADAADAGADVREEDNWNPPPPYGSPPIPLRRVV